MAPSQIPASCPSCGAIFPSRLIAVSGNVKDLTLSGNKETCPFCGQLADTVEGVFDMADGIIEIVSAPHITKQMLDALAAAVKNAYGDKTDPSDLAKEEDAIDPTLGTLVRAFGSKNQLYMTMLLILYFTAKSCSVNVNLDVKLDANQLLDQLRGRPPAAVIVGDDDSDESEPQ